MRKPYRDLYIKCPLFSDFKVEVLAGKGHKQWVKSILPHKICRAGNISHFLMKSAS
jgi:hypothetical protein